MEPLAKTETYKKCGWDPTDLSLIHIQMCIRDSTSSQYASALLMAAVMTGLKIKLTGKRVNGAYIKITLNMLKQFGIKYCLLYTSRCV